MEWTRMNKVDKSIGREKSSNICHVVINTSKNMYLTVFLFTQCLCTEYIHIVSAD